MAKEIEPKPSWFFRHTFDLRNRQEAIYLNHVFGKKHYGFGLLMALCEAMGHHGGYVKNGSEYLVIDMMGISDNEYQKLTDALVECGAAERTDEGFFYHWFSSEYAYRESVSAQTSRAAQKRWDKAKPAGGGESEPQEQAPPPVESEAKPKKAKAAKEPEPDIEDTIESAFFKSIISEYINELDCAKLDIEMSNAQIIKLVKKYGLDLAVHRAKPYYRWKGGELAAGKKFKRQDYYTINTADWLPTSLNDAGKQNRKNTQPEPGTGRAALLNGD